MGCERPATLSGWTFARESIKPFEKHLRAHGMSDVIIIGAGPAGITAALEAATAGAAVTLVSADAVGGRANWASLLPSKVYLTAADHLDESDHFGELGLLGKPPRPDLVRLRERIAALAQEQSNHARTLLESHGVRIVPGRAHFVDGQRMTVTEPDGKREVVSFAKAIIASGSVPWFPPAIRPDGKRIIAPRLAGAMTHWPRHAIVIGGGVTGAEFAYLFRRMGGEVTWITDLARILPRSDPDLTEILAASFTTRGGRLVTGAPVASVHADEDSVLVTLQDGREVTGSHAFIAIGRKPDIADLACDSAGIAHSEAGIRVDGFGRTTVPHIYAVGDVAGPPYVANRGQAQARVAGRHTAGATPLPFRPETVVEAVYTRPQVAQVGLTEVVAAAETRPVSVHGASYGESLKSQLTGETEGRMKILSDPDTGQILGAGAAGDRAADILLPISVAISAGMTIDQLATIYPAYPTLGEMVGLAARAATQG